MFSVIIPLYNKETSIHDTVLSVLNQTFNRYEIIVINDGSTDKSAEVIESFNDSRIRLVTQKNQGVSAARNKGIEEAKNEWIAFLDGDDIWMPNKLSEMERLIKTHPKANWLIHAFDKVRNKTKRIPQTYHKEGKLKDVLFDLAHNLKIQTSAVTVKKDCFLAFDIKFREGYNTSEDREVWYKLAFHFPSPCYSAKILSEYVIDTTGQSLTTNLDNSFKDICNNVDMQDRLTAELSLLDADRKTVFINYLKKLNKKDILNFWCIHKKWNSSFNRNFNKIEVFLFKSTLHLPVIVKKVIKKIFFKIWKIQ